MVVTPGSSDDTIKAILFSNNAGGGYIGMEAIFTATSTLSTIGDAASNIMGYKSFWVGGENTKYRSFQTGADHELLSQTYIVVPMEEIAEISCIRSTIEKVDVNVTDRCNKIRTCQTAPVTWELDSTGRTTIDMNKILTVLNLDEATLDPQVQCSYSSEDMTIQTDNNLAN